MMLANRKETTNAMAARARCRSGFLLGSRNLIVRQKRSPAAMIIDLWPICGTTASENGSKPIKRYVPNKTFGAIKTFVDCCIWETGFFAD